MATSWVQGFIEALGQLEEQRVLEPMLAQFAPNAALWNLVHPEPRRGRDQIREFWQEYRDQFDRICSTFERIIQGDNEAALEWRAEGTLRQGGREVRYRGVTLLRNDEEGITEFASYYDVRPFLEGIGASGSLGGTAVSVNR